MGMMNMFNPFIGGGASEDKVARAEIAAIKDGETLDSFSDVEAALSDKVDKETGKGLSTNDYTTAEKEKLAGIAEGAEVNEIQGIKVNSSTVNPDANKVVNITVPTSAADVSALPDTTKYAAALSLTINSSTFVMTGQLKDQNGDNLGTAQTIDLPLESVVVNGSYNSQTKKVILTLQNGNTIEFSVADLVSGLQTELSANNKLNPAYINYDSTHRAVSDTEKSTWNSKQNAIDSSHKLSADLVDDTSTTNKFATVAELEQIQTNKSNISSNWGAKNLLVNRGSLRKISVDDDIKYTWVNGDVSVTGRKLSEGEAYVDVIPVTPLSDLGLSDKVVISNNGTKCFLAVIFWSETLGLSSIYEIVSGSNIIDIPSGYTHIMARLGVKEGVVASINETIQPMICTKKQWDISHEYQPYPFSNAELTVAEKQNENNISLLETKVNTNAGIISQTYNSTDCNISLILRQDSTEDMYVHYDTEARKLYMPYKVIKNQYKYWKDGVAYYKYHVLTDGVIMTNNSAKCNMLTTDTPEIANETYKHSWVATDDGGSAVTTTFNLSKANSEIGDVWYNRPYIIYDDLETGMRYKMYGPVYKITAGTPCTIECDTLSCTELTAREQANENNISTVSDANGTKNLLDFNDWASKVNTTRATKSISGNSITLTATGKDAYTDGVAATCPASGKIACKPNTTYVITWKTTSTSTSDNVYIFPANASPYYTAATTKYIEYTMPASCQYFTFRFGVANSGDTVTYSNIMICEKSLYDISNQYKPYALSNAELTTKEKQNENNISNIQQTIGDINSVLEEVL